jgi:hypothetical protein
MTSAGEWTQQRVPRQRHEIRSNRRCSLSAKSIIYDPRDRVPRGASRRAFAYMINALVRNVFRRDGRHGDFNDIDHHLRQFKYVFYGLYDYLGWQYDVGKEGFTNALSIAPALAARG